MISTIFHIIIVLLLLFVVVVFGVDLFFFLKNRYIRFHIGRWNNEEEWQTAVEKTALCWVKKTPTVKITDNSRYMIFDMVSGKYRSKNIQSWQKATLIFGLLESDSATSNEAALKEALSLLNSDGTWKNKPATVDYGMLSLAVMTVCDDKDFIKPAMDETLDFISKQINDVGMISYTGGKNNPEMYVDTLGLACPFVAAYGKLYGNSKLEDIAFHQLEMYHKYGMYKDTALPNHAFNIESKLPLGVYGWGRGTAWYLIGLTDTLPFIQNEEYKNKILSWIREAADSYVKYQKSDGGFGAMLQRTQTYDSSATAVMAWFYARCSDLLEDKRYTEVSKRCVRKLMSVTRITGALDWCQGDTKGIGIFAQTYDIMPFAQGMALRALYTLNS